MNKIIRLSMLVLYVLFLFASPVLAVTLPKADRSGAVRLFAEAIETFLAGNDNEIQHLLDETLVKNPYFIDAYLLRALSLRRQGRLTVADRHLASYLEVQQADEGVRRIRNQIQAESQSIEKLLRGEFYPDQFLLLQTTPFQSFGLPFWRVPSFESPHQPIQAFGKFFVSDPAKKRIHIFDTQEKKGSCSVTFNTPSPPRAILPLREDSFLVIDEKGHVLKGNSKAKTLTATDFPVLPVSRLADAAWVAVDQVLVADWQERSLRLCRLSTGAVLSEWTPSSPEEQPLFDPVALSIWGPYLAVADRGNGAIFLLQLPELRFIRSIPLKGPRDVLFFGDAHSAAILDDEGKITICDLLEGTVVQIVNEENPSRKLWALFSENETLKALTFDAREIYQWSPLFTSKQWPLFIVIRDFDVVQNETSEVLQFEIEPFGPQTHLMSTMVPVAGATWLDKALEPRVGPLKETIKDDVPFLLTATADHASDLPLLRLPEDGLSDSFIDKVSDLRPSGLVLDGMFHLSVPEANLLLSYCLVRGIPIHLWAHHVPTELEMRLVRATGGSTFFSSELMGLVRQKEHVLSVEIPLQKDLLPEGRLAPSLFALYIDAGVFSGRSWFPLSNPSRIKPR